jgi:hypothetical protein
MERIGRRSDHDPSSLAEMGCQLVAERGLSRPRSAVDADQHTMAIDAAHSIRDQAQYGVSFERSNRTRVPVEPCWHADQSGGSRQKIAMQYLIEGCRIAQRIGIIK